MRRWQTAKSFSTHFFYKKLTVVHRMYATGKWMTLLWKLCVSHMFTLPYIHHHRHLFFLRNGGFACVKECTYKICTNCFVVIFLGFFCLPAQNETHLLFWRNMVNQYKHQWNKNELILFGGVRCVCAKKIIHTEYKFYWKYAYILYNKLFNARYRQQCTPTHAHRHSHTLWFERFLSGFHFGIL